MSLLSGISDIPFMILAHTGSRSRNLVKLHDKRPVLRTGPNTLSYRDPRAIKDIYGHGTKCTKDGSYVVGAGSHYHLADVVDKSDHARKRKVLSSAYALKNLEGWEHKVADKTARAIRHFDKCCTAPLPSNTAIPAKEDVNLDYRKWMNFFTLDAIADIGLSEKLGFLDKGSDEVMGRKTDGTRYECNLRECLYASNRKQSLLLWSYDYYKVLDKLANMIPFYGRLGKLGAKWDGVPLDLAYRRLERYRAGEKLDDFFQALMEDKKGNPNNLEMGEIVAEVSIMMNAGSVTTAVAMTNIIYQLLKNPEIKKKLVEELDAALDDENEDEDDGASEDPFAAVCSYDRVKHLPYLRACLDESLRLFPPTPHNLGRQTPPEGATILGDYIPGGVSVGMTALAVHWNEDIFPEPHKFIPDRWLGEEGKNNQQYFLAFSAGARGCIGRNISFLEQAVVLASVLPRFEFALPHPDWEIERREGMNWLLGDMPVKIWRRQRATN
jgi:cytochrome P450